MSLSSIQLDAFREVANAGSFSLAAKRLHITQSALSQRILNLEDEITARVFIRDQAGVRLTEVGEELLRFCMARQRMENDVLAKIAGSNEKPIGILKMAGFSSVVRSIIMPLLMEYVNQNPQVQLDVFSREIRDLSGLLINGAVDFIVTSFPSPREDIESLLIGHEALIVAEAAKGSLRPSVFFDHDTEDQTTLQFLRQQRAEFPEGFRREFLDEIYAIVDAVASGLGRAVLPRHLVKQMPKLRTVRGFTPQVSPVYLQYFKQSFRSRLHQDVIKLICAGSKRNLTA